MVKRSVAHGGPHRRGAADGGARPRTGRAPVSYLGSESVKPYAVGSADAELRQVPEFAGLLAAGLDRDATGGTASLRVLRPTHSGSGQRFVEEIHFSAPWSSARDHLGLLLVVDVLAVDTHGGQATFRSRAAAEGPVDAADQSVGAVGYLDAEDRVPSDVLLTRATTRPLARNDGATLEDLATPDTPRLGPLDCAGEALGLQRATPAESLRDLEVGRSIGEPQVRVVLTARKLRLESRPATGLRGRVERTPESFPVHLFPCHRYS